jgi:membrane-bound lytic murein transglycosylase A
MLLAGCSGVPLEPERTAPPLPSTAPSAPPIAPAEALPIGPPIARGNALWVPVPWSDVPGLGSDALDDAWNAWLRSCERPQPVIGALCPEVRRLVLGGADEQRIWMLQRLQPYRVESVQGSVEGLLTGYYEPVIEATRLPTSASAVPLYRPPRGLARGRPWYTRQEIDTSPEARAALRGQEIAYVADPLDALAIQVQGSGKLRVAEPDGRVRLVRLSFAGSNEQPYRSVGSWLLQQGLVRDASWPGIKAWAARNPQRVQEMLWSNPRVVFFREEALADADGGPRGAQGVALTAGRSIAVDPNAIPYGAPVWLASPGPLVNLQRLVFAQDTGSAITGAVRADYFVGSGPDAGDVAGRLKQPLRLWVLWPKPASGAPAAARSTP